MEEAKVGKILLMLRIENVHHSRRVSVTQRILLVPQTLQNKTLGVYWGILGLFFFCTPPRRGHQNVACISRWQSVPVVRARSVNVQPSPCFGVHPILPISPPHRHFSRWKFGPLGDCRKTRFTGYNNSLKTSESSESWKAVLSFRSSGFLKTHTSHLKVLNYCHFWIFGLNFSNFK